MKLITVLRDAFADEADGLGRIGRVMTMADLFTLLNAMAGLLGVVAAASGRLDIAAAMVALSVVLDGADGAAARLWGGGPLGPFLDTLADLLSFGILPAVMLAVGLPSLGVYGFLLGAIWLIASMLRLARFEALREPAKMRYYSGMTTTGAAVLLAAFFLAGVGAWATAAWAGVLSMWMVSRIRTVKLTLWPMVAGALTLFPTFLALVVPLPREYVLASLFTGMAAYTFVGPFYILGRYGPTPNPKESSSSAEE
jgi:phosphatidylserine synthase